MLLAKQCATIDVLSEGRLLPAFGIGSPRAPEWAAMHIDTKTRGRRTDEALEIIGRLWREESVDFAGEHFRLTGASISPKPAQPDLPMWIGGGSEAAVRRTARLGTGWLGGPEMPDEAGRIVAAIRAELEKTGRSIDDDHYGASFPFHFGQAADPMIERPMQTYEKRTGRDPARLFRRRRRGGHRRPPRRIHRCRRIQVRAAAGRDGRRPRHRPDAAIDRAGAAGCCHPLAQAREEATVTSSSLTPP